MKIRNIVLGLAVATTLVATQSCSKIDEFGDMNLDPNRATEPVPSALLTNVLSNLGNNLGWDQGGLNTVAGLYAQYFSETQYTESSRYARTTFNIDGYYTGPLQDLQTIISYNSDAATAVKAAQYGTNQNQIAIARILKAQYFKMLTDAFGDIPYFSALKGGSGQNAYDKQEVIYPDIIKELKEAAAQLNPSAPIAIKGDIMFNGNITRWRRLANSLRALAALNLAKANPTLGRTEFASAIADGVIETNADNATIAYPGGKFPNPFYNYFNITQRKDYAVSKTFTDRITNDPRRTAYASSTVGFPYGLQRAQAEAFASANSNYAVPMSSANRQENSPIVIIGAGNMWLARAEAAQRAWTNEDKTITYNTGIQRSMEQWGVYTASDYASYIAANPSTDLAAIATQEWISWFPNGMEGWNVWRRTGSPALTPAPGMTAIPRRFNYGPNEYNLNNVNVQAAAGRYTAAGIPDSQYARIWWDQ
jgi:hypothetical protein